METGSDPGAMNLEPAHMSEALRTQIESVLDGFRPRLSLDGADVLLLDLSAEGLLRIRLTGPHACCPMAVATLQSCIESALRHIPAVKRVLAAKG